MFKNKHKTVSGQVSKWISGMLLTYALTHLLTCSGLAQLTATVTPGYTFAPGEAPTTATLNLLGKPAVAISGTISGAVGLSANSVGGDLLKDSVVDGITLDFTPTGTNRSIEIKNGGVSPDQISNSIAGAGLGGGWNGVAALPLFITFTNVINTSQFATNSSGDLILAGTSNAVPSGSGAQLPCVSPISTAGGLLAITNFTYTSGSISGLGTGLAINQAHGMTNGTPRFVRWVAVETSAGGDSGYSQNQEVDISAFWSGSFSTAFSGGANGTDVWLVINNAGVGFGIINGTTGAAATINAVNWELKAYVWQ